ncbi:MAG: hypothetical protein MI923_02255 [Phycisphaerales bacterium]|nr:hypothetical protein [Phycisphaerales bacterium]
MNNRELETLARAAARGDRVSLSQLYDALSPSLYGFLADFTRDPHEAEDLLHQVWLLQAEFRSLASIQKDDLSLQRRRVF